MSNIYQTSINGASGTWSLSGVSINSGGKNQQLKTNLKQTVVLESKTRTAEKELENIHLFKTEWKLVEWLSKTIIVSFTTIK